MVNGIIDAQEPVVRTVERHKINRCVLCVVFSDINLDLRQKHLGIDLSRYAFLAFIKHLQHTIIGIVINEDDTSFGFADTIVDEGIGIEDLTTCW